MKKIKTITINCNTFEIDDPDAPGKITEEGGVNLVDYIKSIVKGA